MYVCLCGGVTDSDIVKAIDNGHSTLKMLQTSTGAMMQCCKCVNDCIQLLDTHQPNHTCVASDTVSTHPD